MAAPLIDSHNAAINLDRSRLFRQSADVVSLSLFRGAAEIAKTAIREEEEDTICKSSDPGWPDRILFDALMEAEN